MFNILRSAHVLLMLHLISISCEETVKTNAINDNKVAIDIRITIPKDDGTDDIKGLISSGSFLDHAISVFNVTTKYAKRRLKICVVATFLTSILTDPTPRHISMLEIGNVHGVKAKIRERSTDRNIKTIPDQLKNEYSHPEAFGRFVSEGTPEVPIFVQKASDDLTNSSTWEKNIKESLLKRLDASNITHGWLIVTNHFGNPANYPLKIGVYDLTDKRKPRQPFWKKTFNSGEGFGMASKEAISETWKGIRDRLKKCPYRTSFNSECYWYTMESCRKQVKRTTDPSKTAYPKYCMSGHHYHYNCDASECDRRCSKYVTWSQCVTSENCGRGKRRQQLTRNERDSVSFFYSNCPTAYKPKMEECVVICPWAMAVLVTGASLFVATMVIFFGGYWFFWRKRKASGTHTDTSSEF